MEDPVNEEAGMAGQSEDRRRRNANASYCPSRSMSRRMREVHERESVKRTR